MKKNSFFIILLIFSSTFCYGQGNKNIQASIPFTAKNLVGVWQEKDKIVGNGIGQNFQFFKDGHFILNLCNPGEDLRNTIRIKGKYRLKGDSLMFTILSRVEISGGDIDLSGGGSETFLFAIKGGEAKEIPAKNPHELKDPAYIIVQNIKHIFIGPEEYYKVSADPNTWLNK